jgi:hypothetical protein
MHDTETLLKKLQKKGWSEEELHHAGIVLSQHHEHHHIVHPRYDKTLPWIVFFSILLGNIITFLILIPPLYAFDHPAIYIIVGSVALGFGLVYDIIFKNMTHLKQHHHFGIAIILPLISMASFANLLFITNTYFYSGSSIIIKHPLIISGTYAIMLLLPYYIRRIVQFIRE